jgi:hypothetical protein
VNRGFTKKSIKMSRTTKIPFLFDLPISSLGKNGSGLFYASKVGDLQISGKGKILGVPEDYPYALMTDEQRKWIEIEVLEVHWITPNPAAQPRDTDITLLLRHMKEAREINRAILEAAADYCAIVYSQNFIK